jgi:sugar lactone lactonase YvrE
VPRRSGRAAIGLKADRGRLFVAGGPTGHGFVYDARTGRDIRDVTLTPAPTFINDVTVTRAAAYFTDSQRPQLYRLPLGPSGAPAAAATAVPYTGELRYDTDPSTFEANGIAATADGRTLLVAHSRTAAVYTVDPATGASRRIALTGGSGRLDNVDGILLAGRTLYAVQNRQNRIAVVRLAADLRSGRILRTIRDADFDVPTTVARKGTALFAVNARFGTTARSTTPYDIVRVSALPAR